MYKVGEDTKKDLLYNLIQLFLLLLALQNVYVQSKRFDNATPVSKTFQTVAWIIAGINKRNLI